jgi:hypothetical protein
MMDNLDRFQKLISISIGRDPQAYIIYLPTCKNFGCRVPFYPPHTPPPLLCAIRKDSNTNPATLIFLPLDVLGVRLC